jgi:hypothetical protein
MAAGLNYECAPLLNPEKRNTEVTKNQREPQRKPATSPGPPFRTLCTKPSVPSVAFLCVLCVKFRKP